MGDAMGRAGRTWVEVIGLLLAVVGGLVLVATAAQYAEDNAVAAGLMLLVGLVCMQLGARRGRRPAGPAA